MNEAANRGGLVTYSSKTTSGFPSRKPSGSAAFAPSRPIPPHRGGRGRGGGDRRALLRRRSFALLVSWARRGLAAAARLLANSFRADHQANSAPRRNASSALFGFPCA